MPKILLTMVLVVWGALAGWAETPLAWSRAVELAVQNNLVLQSVSQSVQQAYYDYRSTSGQLSPQFSGDANYNFSNSFTNQTSTDRYSVGLSARQELYSGDGTQSQIEKSRLAYQGWRIEWQAALAQLSYDLTARYAQVLYAQKELTLAEKISDRLKENVKLVRLRFDAGRENKGSLLKTEAAYAQAVYNVNAARRSLESAQTHLKALLGQSGENFQVENFTLPPLQTQSDRKSIIRTVASAMSQSAA